MTEKGLRILLMGPPGCGKGTQASELKSLFSLPHVSSGDVLREEVRKGSELGKKIKEFMDRGEIGPVELITEAIIGHLKNECADGFILDGFPRTLYQAEKLKENFRINFAFLIDATGDAVANRITSRRICRGCGAIYSLNDNPPAKEGVCDTCGGEVYRRADDNRDTIINRIRVYMEETKPVIEFYREDGILHEINGEKDRKSVFDDIISIIKE